MVKRCSFIKVGSLCQEEINLSNGSAQCLCQYSTKEHSLNSKIVANGRKIWNRRLELLLKCKTSILIKSLQMLIQAFSSQRAWRTSPTSWPLGLRFLQSTRSCGAWPRLRVGGTGKESSTSLRCSAPRTRLPGWSWPNGVTREAQSYSGNMMVREVHFYISQNAFRYYP